MSPHLGTYILSHLLVYLNILFMKKCSKIKKEAMAKEETTASEAERSTY
jgi:hypothetical protein